VLTYKELFGTSALACPSPGTPGTLFGYPACVYGFFMYCILVGISVFGLTGVRRIGLEANTTTGMLEPPSPRSYS
jgi:hypothetical protein